MCAFIHILIKRIFLQVFDGVTIGFRVSMCCMVRPWERPNDIDHLKSIGALTGHPSSLYGGCDMDDYTMIPAKEPRLVLWKLAEGKSVSAVQHSSLLKWLGENRHEILPYIKTVQSDSGQYTLVDSDVDYKLIRSVIAHWGCPDPELKLIPPPVFRAVQTIIDADGQYDAVLMQPINLYADGLHSLIEYDVRMHPLLAEGGKLSSQLASLLRRSLGIAQSSIRDKSKRRELDDVTKPFDRSLHFETDFEEFVRTGTYSPAHPVMRTFPFFRQDYLGLMAQNRRTSKRAAARAEAQQLLRVQSEKMGATCNKYKARTSALTPGLFTVFCGSCGVCEYVELMPRFESPVTAFRVFAHRAWRGDDHRVIQNWKQSGIWDDCM